MPPLPSGVGDEIMKAFALKPSRLIGDIKRALEEAIAKRRRSSRTRSARRTSTSSSGDKPIAI